MSFSIKLKKNEEGKLEVDGQGGEMPEHITVSGHAQDGKVVELSASTPGLAIIGNAR